ncbi:hypothetical protein BH10ACI2_BH10ACI2_06620 [soil metagenome]
MREQLLETKPDGVFNGVLNLAGQAAQAGLKVERLKEKASHLIEDGMTDVHRLAKRGRYAAEDLVEDTAHRIKKDPWPAVGITFGAGVVFGAVIGIMVGLKTRQREETGF